MHSNLSDSQSEGASSSEGKKAGIQCKYCGLLVSAPCVVDGQAGSCQPWVHQVPETQDVESALFMPQGNTSFVSKVIQWGKSVFWRLFP